jgi:hypothetical protein
LRSALESKNAATVAIAMGDDATVADAKAFMTKEKGFTSKYLSVAVPDATNVDTATLTFYKSDPKKGLAPIVCNWAGYRWSVAR